MKDTKLQEKATEMHNTFPLLISDLYSRIEATVLNFSDMDFAIIPNKESILDELYKKQDGGVGSPRSKRPRGTPKTFQKEQEEEAEKKEAAKEAAKQAAKKRREAEKEEENEAKRMKKQTKPPPQDKPSPKSPGSASSQEGPSGEHKEEKSHGFLLVRLKSSNQFVAPYEGLIPSIKDILKEINRLSQMINQYSPSKKEEACNNESDLQKLGKPTLPFLAQTQLFRESNLNVDGLSEDCKTFLQFKKQEKKLIGALTSMNINIFVDYLSKKGKEPKDKLEAEPEDKLEAEPEDKLEAFMNFLHENGKLQNKKIETLSKKLKYSSKQEVKDNFESIEAICDTTKPLFEIMSELVLEFSQRKEVEKVMKLITKKLNQDIDRSFKSNPCYYRNVYSKHISHKLNIKNKLHTINKLSSKYNLPEISKITTNATFKHDNLESTRIKTDDEKAEEKAIDDEIDGFMASTIIDDELEQEIEELIPGFSKLSIRESRKQDKTIGEGKAGKKTRKKRNKKSNEKTRKKRNLRRKKYTKKNKKG